MDALKNTAQALWLPNASASNENEEVEPTPEKSTDYRSEDVAKCAYVLFVFHLKFYFYFPLFDDILFHGMLRLNH
jgi:hypothetical protein